MSFLKRWRASPKNLCGPDVDKSHEKVIRISDTIFRLFCPPHSTEAPYISTPSIADIESDAEYSNVVDNTRLRTKVLLRTGWNFYAGIAPSDSLGALMMHIALNRLDGGIESSLFHPEAHAQWIIDHARESYGTWNASMLQEKDSDLDEETYKLRYFFQYPKSSEDILEKTFKNSTWQCYQIFQPGRAKHSYYRLPIGDRHSLLVIFEPSRFAGDYYSPDSNLPEAVDKTIRDIMNSVEVVLSPEAERQRQAALSNA